MNSIVLTANVQPNLDVNYIGMDVHSDNVVVCVRRNTINSRGVSRFLCPGWFSRGQPITAVLRV